MNEQELRKHDGKEAAGLQTFLLENYPDQRPEYPNGIMAWALAALKARQEDDATLLSHVNAAEKLARPRSRYIHDVLGMVKRHLMKGT